MIIEVQSLLEKKYLHYLMLYLVFESPEFAFLAGDWIDSRGWHMKVGRVAHCRLMAI